MANKKHLVPGTIVATPTGVARVTDAGTLQQIGKPLPPATDALGFVTGTLSPRGGRAFVAVRGPELKALERSDHPSLLKLATRVRDAVAKMDSEWEARIKRSEALREAARQHQAAIDADPVKKAEQVKQRAEVARSTGPFMNAMNGLVKKAVKP